jgi:glycosyltransferase involved in cell wall biosynthesis
LKLVLFGPYPIDPQFTNGGVEKVMFNTVEGLRGREGLDLHVVSLSRVKKETVVEHGDVTIHHVPQQQRFSLPTFRILSVLRARRTIRRLKPDLIHCQESGRESYIASALSFPSLATIHAVFKNEGAHYPGLKAKFRYWQFGMLAQRAERGIGRFIPSSAYAADALTHLAHKLHGVVENPIEQRYFEAADEPVPGRMLFAGTIYPRKGIDVLIRAAAILRDRGVDFCAHVAGGISDKEHQNMLHGMVADMKLEKNVIFRGFLSEDELTRDFKESYLVVLPSFAETSPMTVQQAMAAGKPVVGTKVGGVPMLVEDGVHGRLVDAGDHEALADALQEVLEDPARRAEMGRLAKQEATTRFSARIVGDQMMEIYTKFLEGGYTR